MHRICWFFLTTLFLFQLSCAPARSVYQGAVLPSTLKGDFTDDYGIRYSINDSTWLQHPASTYHIIRYDSAGSFLVVRNDRKNPGEPGLYSRIDITHFEGMPPYEWGFCLTLYNAVTIKEALRATPADREHPRTGCGGYPFSRMKRQ